MPRPAPAYPSAGPAGPLRTLILCHPTRTLICVIYIDIRLEFQGAHQSDIFTISEGKSSRLDIMLLSKGARRVSADDFPNPFLYTTSNRIGTVRIVN